MYFLSGMKYKRVRIVTGSMGCIFQVSFSKLVMESETADPLVSTLISVVSMCSITAQWNAYI